MNFQEVWKNLAQDVNELDKKIDSTNPFSQFNYCNKRYTDFFNYYSPHRRSIMLWVDDIDD